MILRHVDKLSQTLQQPDFSCSDGHGIVVRAVASLRTGANSDLFWEKVKKRRGPIDVNEPRLARKGRAPRWFEEGSAPAEFPLSAKDEYCRVFFEAI